MQYVAEHCEGCPFTGPRVGSKGPIDSPFVIVGESPGKDELRKGEPFVGDSGELLDYATAQNKLPWPTYYTNALQCYPGSGDQKQNLLAGAVGCCRDRLLHELGLHPRKVILCLGGPAIWSVTGDFGLKPTQVRGRVITGNPLAEYIVLTNHPAFLLRGGGSLRQFLGDVNYAQLLALGHPPIIPGQVSWEELTEGSIQHFIQVLQNQHLVQVIASDLETTGLSHIDHEPIISGFTFDGNHVYILPEHLLHYLPAIHIAGTHAKWVWHNGKFDVKMLWRAKYPVPKEYARVDEDTMLESYCLDEQRGIHDLETVAGDWIRSPNWKHMLEPHLPPKKIRNLEPRRSFYEVIPRHILNQYAAYDIADTWRVHQILKPKIDADKLNTKLYNRILIPGSKYFATMEDNGATLDQERIRINYRRTTKVMRRHRKDLQRLSKKLGYRYNINPNSPIQIAEFLYDYCKLPTTWGRGTDKSILAHLPNHPGLTALLKYRKAAKQRSTYVIMLMEGDPKTSMVDSDHRIHATYKIHGTPTGRLASSEPNMQNIPRDPMIRGQFHAAPGRIFAEVDLNQAELRSLACLSRDPVLHKIYTTKGMSLHEVTRASIYDVPDNWSARNVSDFLEQFALTEATRFIRNDDGSIREDRIITEQKMRAKAVNFGIVYGREAPSLAEEFEQPVKETKKWVDAWPKTYPAAWEFIQTCRRAPVLNKNLVTPFGRRKRNRVVTAARLKNLQNEAANFPHQSIAADITNQGGILTYEELIELYDTYIWNTVHDSNLLDMPDEVEIIKQAVAKLVATMEQVPIDWGLTFVPFIAEAKIGPRWGSQMDYGKWLKSLEAS